MFPFACDSSQEKFLDKFCGDAYARCVQDRKKSLSYKHLCKFLVPHPFLFANLLSFLRLSLILKSVRKQQPASTLSFSLDSKPTSES